MNNILTVFLDIDGVLRRHSAKQYKLELPLVANLQRWIAKQTKEVELVISSTWRYVYTLDQIRAMFPITLRFKIVGQTPTLINACEHQRYKEVIAYNHKYGIENWVAFDDQPDLFPSGISNVVAINGEEGFQL